MNEGAAFHCYAGGFPNQEAFISAYPSKEVYFTVSFALYSLKFCSDGSFCTYRSALAPYRRTGGLTSNGTCTTCEGFKYGSSEPDLPRVDSLVVRATTRELFCSGTLPLTQTDHLSYLDQALVSQDVGLSCLSITTSGA